MNKHWILKILGAVLVLYSIVFGLLIPLKPGIVSVSPSLTSAGDTLTLEYESYNIDYSNLTERDVSIWLLMDSSRIISSGEVTFLEEQKVRTQFKIPFSRPEDPDVLSSTLVVSDSTNGYALLPSAVAVQKQISTDDNSEKTYPSADVEVDFPGGPTFPFRNILKETIRNTYYHVPLWFSMIVLFLFSAYNSINYLRKREISYDIRASAHAEIAILLGILGLLTGAIWARFTWGAFWSWDVKQFTSAVSLLIYLAYFILRSSITDVDKRARLTASYNIFAFILLIPLLFIIPRMTDSLHPGNGGNPAMGGEDLDSTMRMVFYPAVIGWILIGLWLSELKARYLAISWKKSEDFMLDNV